MKLSGDTTGKLKIRVSPSAFIYLDPGKDIRKARKFYKSLLKRENPPPRKLDEIVIVALPRE